MRIQMVMRQVCSLNAALQLLSCLCLSDIGWHLIAIDRLVTTFPAKVAGDHHLFPFFRLHVLDRGKLETRAETE